MFTAKIQYDESVIRKLAKVQYNYFGIKVQLCILGISFFLILLPVARIISGPAATLSLILGSCIAASLNYPARQKARNMIESAVGDFLYVEYYFMDEAIHVEVGKEIADISYEKIIAFLSDAEYVYLFLSQRSGYVIARNSLQPNDYYSFETFIEEKTGLSRESSRSLLFSNIKVLLNRLHQ